MSSLPASSETPTGASAHPSESRQAAKSKPRRQLACVLCQQRKVKCDHNYPCATCVKARVQCVQATQAPRRRRRQFPERDLLVRLRQYEDLLSQHNIKFEPLHTNPTIEDKNSPASTGKASNESDDEELGKSGQGLPGTITPGSMRTKVYESKRMFNVMREEVRDHDKDDSSDDEVQPIVFKKAWDEAIENDDHLLFGWPQTAVAMYTLHPQPVQVFQLWQLYLDNVNPLLKVTHTPSLQGRIIEAAGNVLNIKPELEALMFSIYCSAISSLSADDCHAMFGSPKPDLLAGYQLGCQQALLNARFLRCTSRDCLTALYLYLVSIRPNTTPESLSSMLGIAVRIAQRMGIHNEAVLTKSTPLEAEMSRRLWWSLILFDTRIGEMADFQATSLLPLWDCRVPLNVNDSDLRLDMKEPPRIQGNSTDALFTVVRSELGDFVRHTMFHLGYYGPSLKPADGDTKSPTDKEGGETDSFEKTIEAKYLTLCNPDDPLHFMTIWTTRGNIAKFRLMEHHSRYAGSPLHQAEPQREAALSYALSMLECNTRLVTSPLTKRFIWMVNSNFPFVGYIQTVQYLKWRPMSAQANAAWQVMSDNYHAHTDLLSGGTRFFELLASFVLQAWDARKAAFNESGSSLETPQIVLSIRQRLARIASGADNPGARQLHDVMDMGSTDFLMPTTMGSGVYNTTNNIGVHNDYTFSGLGGCSDIPGVSLQDMQMDYVDWSAMNWDMGNTSLNETGTTKGPEHHVQHHRH
ncbi:Nn.00g077350.m01.CDS01 [Neocucurbitaria sp. VM-36]